MSTKIKKFKLCRRLGPGIYEKCQSPKFAASKKVGARKPKTLSTFAYQMIEKQKMRYSYGLREKQFYNYVQKSLASKKQKPTEHLSQLLETRLDNVVYRMGIAPTRKMARQLVNHGHFIVNDTKVNIPSFHVKKDDAIRVKDGSKKSPAFTVLEENLKQYKSPDWLNFDSGKLEGKVIGMPGHIEEIFDTQSVLEFYSR